jgi:hypothetical protein
LLRRPPSLHSRKQQKDGAVELIETLGNHRWIGVRVVGDPVGKLLAAFGGNVRIDRSAESSVESHASVNVAYGVIIAIDLGSEDFLVFRFRIGNPLDKIGQFVDVMALWQVHPIIRRCRDVGVGRMILVLSKLLS